jgi:hypothetical protein
LQVPLQHESAVHGFLSSQSPVHAALVCSQVLQLQVSTVHGSPSSVTICGCWQV